MRRSLLVLWLVVAACGGAAGGSVATSGTDPGNEPDPIDESAPDPSAEAAPDFSLALADGGTFGLRAESKPVYMVFWAEW